MSSRDLRGTPADLGAGFRCRAADDAAGALRATVEIDPGSTWFAGHFPGDPILPAIGQLDLLRRLRLHRGTSSHLAAVDTLRLAEAVRPGDLLRVELGPDSDDGRSPVTLTRDSGDPVSRGTLRWADEAVEESDREPIPPNGAPRDRSGPAAALTLPHAPPARFAEEILEATADRALCRGAVPPDHAAVSAGRAPALTAVELAAQSAAALDAGTSTPAIGYIVRLRSVELPVPTLPAATPLLARVSRDSRHGPLTLVSFEVETENGEKLLARGVLGVYLPEG